ncbi:MAG: sodium:solute symporter family protein [Hyphomicrobiaceae bacterium]|nr:sodium:solute symporter family protein [Hyphomicrobiaceae bacterium]
MNATLLAIAAYVAVQFAIGIWVSRQIATQSDYINAGRQLGPLVGAFSVFATWFGAEAIVGAGGSVYAEGLNGATIDPFGYAAALVIAGLVMAMPLWRRGYLTFGDFFRDRYSPAVERLAVLLILPGPIIWAAAQIRGFGVVVGSVSDVSLATGMIVGTLVIVAYTAIGGLLADAYTDLLQGLAIVLGLIVIAVLVATEVGGVGPGLATVPPERLAYASGDTSALALAEQWLIPICGTMVSIELISRMLATRSALTARNACIVGGTMYLLVGLIPVFLGLIGPVLVPNLANPEEIVSKLAAAYLPPVLFVVFIGAIVSAILSTVDTALLAAGSMLSHNAARSVMAGLGESARLLATRLTVAALGVTACIIALGSESIHDLVETASAFGSAGLIVVALFGLFTRLGGPRSALATLVTGMGVWSADTLMGFTETPYVVALAAATAVYLLVAIVLNDSATDQRPHTPA